MLITAMNLQRINHVLTSPSLRTPLYTRPNPPFPIKFLSLNEQVASSISLRVNTDEQLRRLVGGL